MSKFHTFVNKSATPTNSLRKRKRRQHETKVLIYLITAFLQGSNFCRVFDRISENTFLLALVCSRLYKKGMDGIKV